jgi:hypothetical protein
MVGGWPATNGLVSKPHSPAALRAFANAGYCPEENPIGAASAHMHGG